MAVTTQSWQETSQTCVDLHIFHLMANNYSILAGKLFVQDTTLITQPNECGTGTTQELGSGFPSRNDLNRTRDLPGCEKGTSCDAPLTVANVSRFP